MSSLFKANSWFDAEADAHRGILDEFGETLLFQPFARKPNQMATPDATRPTFTVPAVFERMARQVGLKLEETTISTRELVLHVLVCDLQCVVRQGDRFTLCETREVFEVTDTNKDGVSGMAIRLVQLGVQS